MFTSALRSALEVDHAAFDSEGTRHQIVQQSAAADIEIGKQAVVWRFDNAKLGELIDLTESLIAVGTPGHQYADINSPTLTLIVSVNEHV